MTSFKRLGRDDLPIDDATREKDMKYLRDFTNPDELVVSIIIDWLESENIAYECAPYEAEWQLVQAEKEGVIDAVMTTDGDAIILGAKVVVFDVNFKKKQCKVCRQEEFITGKVPLANYNPTTWPASMLGSDYHARIPNVGFKRVFDILPNLTDFEPETIAAAMEATYPSQWNKLPESMIILRVWPS